MTSIAMLTADGARREVDDNSVGRLRAALAGGLLQQGDEGYEEARQIWNAMIDRRPALIARCTSVEHVQAALAFARDEGALVSVRGGGHNIAGTALSDGGLVIDLSRMRNVAVDAQARRAVVEAGAILGDFDAEAQKHGLVTPLGINSTTGVAGLTLGGGFGWLSRKFGMTIDNLESAEVVLADGRIVRASEREQPDLFWALRGGGGNFGVVTRFDFRLHELGPDVLAGLIVFPFAQAEQVLKRYRDFVPSMPDELNVWAVLRQAPPLPFLPAEVHGKEVVVLALCYAGTPAEGERLIERLRSFGTPHGEHVGVQPYVAWQTAFDPLLTPGVRNYWKSHNFNELGDGALAAMLDSAGKLPSPMCEVFIGLLGGAVARVPSEATAYVDRGAPFVMNVHSRWAETSDDDRCVAWARDLFKATAPHASGGVYVNFLTQDEGDRVRAAYGANYERLADVKRHYDPENLFRHNQNIVPRSSGSLAGSSRS